MAIKPVIYIPADGQVGVAFSYQISADNSPTSFNAYGGPVGLSINKTTGLLYGTPTTSGIYGITISATNSAGTGSAILRFRVKPKPVPVNANVSWTQVATATGYKVFWGTASNTYPSSADAAASLSYTVSGLTGGNTYYFAAEAYNAGGSSPYSNEVVFLA